jgi:hypothetical protein
MSRPSSPVNDKAAVMIKSLPMQHIIDAKLIGVEHSHYSAPTFIVEGIGPAAFRSHFLLLETGIVLDLFTSEITLATLRHETMPGETIGIPLNELLGLRITALVLDDALSSLVILDGIFFLKDANDGFYGNPLLAGKLKEGYSAEELSGFVDYWTEEPAHFFAG